VVAVGLVEPHLLEVAESSSFGAFQALQAWMLALQASRPLEVVLRLGLLQVVLQSLELPQLMPLRAMLLPLLVLESLPQLVPRPFQQPLPLTRVPMVPELLQVVPLVRVQMLLGLELWATSLQASLGHLVPVCQECQILVSSLNPLLRSLWFGSHLAVQAIRLQQR